MSTEFESSVRNFFRLFDSKFTHYNLFTETGKDQHSGKVSGKYTVKKKLDYNEMILHIAAPDMYIGRNPLLKESKVIWCCLDIDVPDITRFEITNMTSIFSIPLVLTQSKSSRLRLWFFFKKPEDGNRVKNILSSFKKGFHKKDEEIEVFPKSLAANSKGGHLLLPKPIEYKIWLNGKMVSVDSFISHVENNRIDLSSLEQKLPAIAPKCLYGSLYSNKCIDSLRNDTLFKVAIWLKTFCEQDRLRDCLYYINTHRVLDPLDVTEVDTIAGSIFKTDYKKKCVKGCQHNSTCTYNGALKGNADLITIEAADFSVVRLYKYIGDIPLYKIELKIPGLEKNAIINLGTSENLIRPAAFSRKVFEHTGILPRSVKPDDWRDLINALSPITEEVAYTKDSEIETLIFDNLAKYIRIAFSEDISSVRNAHCAYYDRKTGITYFKLNSFIQWLGREARVSVTNTNQIADIIKSTFFIEEVSLKVPLLDVNKKPKEYTSIKVTSLKAKQSPMNLTYANNLILEY